MKKVNIANFVIYDLANRFNSSTHLDMDKEFVDLVAEHWYKKHFVSASRDIQNHHNECIHHRYII